MGFRAVYASFLLNSFPDENWGPKKPQKVVTGVNGDLEGLVRRHTHTQTHIDTYIYIYIYTQLHVRRHTGKA